MRLRSGRGQACATSRAVEGRAGSRRSLPPLTSPGPGSHPDFGRLLLPPLLGTQPWPAPGLSRLPFCSEPSRAPRKCPSPAPSSLRPQVWLGGRAEDAQRFLSPQFDADREEDDVFRDISLAVASKLFPSQEAAAAAGPPDLRVDAADGPAPGAGSDWEEQGDEDEADVCGDADAEDLAELRKFKIVFVIGGPGSGKGTQCEKLVRKYGFAHVCVAELLRDELASGSPRSLLLGAAPPAAAVLDLLKEALLARSAPGLRGFLIEGYPQELKQGHEFERRVGPPQLVMCMECSADTMSRRLLQRDGESPEAVARRLQTYYRASLAVAAHYEETAPFHKINAEGSPEEVFLHVCSAVDAIF
ncbi:adenylate kinase isoenzyme 5 [Monodelphis domestica]|uniref:adenylate kinase isoenzyme 5 n=1 Tax=Monodelphis domestica TaxID=13616 RepID=UPI0024E20F97|nr:adenylate kinase isoenzyme 5 [Monodelphis domestica]